MRICVVGSGYVGLITACGFAKLGHRVSCVDVDREKVEMINRGVPPIYEEGLEELLGEVLKGGLTATTELEGAVREAEAVFITVGTPSSEDGSADLQYVEKAFLDALSASDSYKLFVVKSTVVPGTTDALSSLAKEKLGKIEGKDFGLCMNPEFLREGKAINDFFHPDRIIIGAEDGKALGIARSLYSGFGCPVVETGRRSAEMIKYASNSLLATKISFANEVGNICKKLGIDVYEVMDAVGLDKRIERSFLDAGIGFGGSCFPKDVKALAHLGRGKGVEPRLLDSVMEVNESQPGKLVELAASRLGGLGGKKVAVLGIAFKPGTDDIREAPGIGVLSSLLEAGAIPMAYDPKAMGNAKKVFGEKVEYAGSAGEALAFSEIVFLLTEWGEFGEPSLYAGKKIFDGRRVLKRKSEGDYEGICW